MQEQSYRAWLSAQGLHPKTVIDQISRVRRIELSFGDLDIAYSRDDLREVISKLEYSRGDANSGRPLPHGIEYYGDAVSTMATLKHAAKKYQAYLDANRNAGTSLDLEKMLPLRVPRAAGTRKLQPTGYWAFQASPRRWDVDRWLAAGEGELLYLVSKDDGPLMQAGDLAVLRRNATPRRPACVVAVLEVVEPPKVRPEPDVRFFRDPTEGAPTLRAKLEVLTSFDDPVEIARLSAASGRLRESLQRSTVAIEPESFFEIARLTGLTPIELAARRASRTPAQVSAIEQSAQVLDPKRREVISQIIERGPIGRQVKAARGHRCQVCEHLGLQGIAFRKPDGQPYAEAHHVIPVNQLKPGTLAPVNIMVLCPNHHRQAHYGAFAIIRDDSREWLIRVDGRDMAVPKTTL